ncbi:MAG: iron-containing alcohol dehydrogenase [Bacteroidales bacterium]|nr:iron-containing alcohol dehydrogenase [Bacteroidales bacterium]
MRDFVYYTPTEVVFGRKSEDSLIPLLNKYGAGKVLIHYGGGSAVRSGLIPKIKAMLDSAGLPWVELGGVVPNPHLSLVYEGIKLCRKERVDFILAVGGGSVIDSAKGIAYGIRYDGDVWDFFDGKAAPKDSAPVGVVLTIPASGSEMSDSCVLTNTEKGQKRGCNSNFCRCRFAIMNPERTLTLPDFQTACGITDIMMHSMERYFTPDAPMPITDSLCEGLMRDVRVTGEKLMADPHNYELRASIMWSGSLAHNGLTGCGVRFDFGTHRLEHELSTMYGVAHGAGLAALWCHWAKYVMAENPSRFRSFAIKVMDIPDGPEAARRGIDAMRDFYRRIGMPTSIPELIGRKATREEIETMADRCSRGGTFTVGAFKVLGRPEMIDIYTKANE